MTISRAAILPILLAGLAVAVADAQPVANSAYADSTLVVYNRTSPESRALAAFYVQERGLSVDHVVALDCPMDETITREQFTATIAEPLRAFMEDKRLWELGEIGGGRAATACKIHIVALMRGVPLRIAATPLPPTGKVDADGKPVPPVADKRVTDEASVDSELALLSFAAAPTRSMGPNPYFRQQQPKGQAGLAPMMLVGRIDGPDWETPRRLISDAIAAEKSGLWGNAYIDLSRMDLTKGPGYKIGDEWLRNISGTYEHAGIPTYVDGHPERLASNFPLGEDAILYFGWYATNADGPFRDDSAFRFKRGAVACHIHSYSATTIRNTRQWWVGPLLGRGAAAVLGNVYEPFLTYTTHLDLFNQRLLEGYTFIEAAWMATPSVSWMNIMVGDPLYQPFLPGRSYGKQPDADFKAVRLAVERWRDEPELFENLELAAEKLDSAKVLEAVGLRRREALQLDEATSAFARAAAMFQAKPDKLRMDLYRIEIIRGKGEKKQAVAELRKILPAYQGIPESQAVEALINQLDPPPPPPPPPPAGK